MPFDSMPPHLSPHHDNRPFFDGNPKMIFLFGVVLGIALTLVFGQLLGVTGGASTGTGTTTATTTGTPTTKPTTATGKLAAVTSADHVRGDIKKAKVVMIEYADYQCPYCGTHHPTMLDLMTKYGKDVVWVYRHFPLTSIHPNARPSALAAECVNEQSADKFWQFTDAMFANQAKLSSDYYKEVAQSLGLDMTKFNNCVSTEKYASVVDADTASGQAAGVTGTPATFVNGQLVSGAVPEATFVTLIDGLLKK